VRFPNRGRGGENPGHGGSAADVRSRGQLGGVAVSPLTLLAGSVTSATVGSHASWSVDREAIVETFPPSTGRGLGCSSEGSTAGERGVSLGTTEVAREYGRDVIYSEFDFSEICPPSVRHNARMKFKFRFLKISSVGCQGI
jgi:hypothetical protein